MLEFRSGESLRITARDPVVRSIRILCVVAIWTASVFAPRIAQSEDWPAWGGPSGQGVSKDTDAPTEWGPEKNVRWKLPLPDAGNSTPIVLGSRIFLTQATKKGDNIGAVRSTWCVERKNGKVIWKRDVAFEDEELTHKTNPFCSASPVTDGECVIVSHGSAGVFCYDLEGKELWRRDLGKFQHIWGNASSPVIFEDRCLLNCGPGERTFLIALDKKTGKTLWQKDIPGGADGSGGNKTWTGSWSTPLIIREGRDDVALVSYPRTLHAFRVRDGEEIWRCGGLGKLVYTSPIVSKGPTGSKGIAVAMSGYMGPAIGVRLGGKSDVTATHRLWRHEREPQRIGSGVVVDGHVFINNDPGTLQCFELETGKVLWTERLSRKSWSSLVRCGDRLYALDDRGTCHVVRASTKFEVLSKNELREPVRASIAISGDELFIRTYKHLWCIGKADNSETGAR